MKFKKNPNKPSFELLIKEIDHLIAGAEEKYPKLVQSQKMSETTAQFKWNMLHHIRDIVVAAGAPSLGLEVASEPVEEKDDDPGPVYHTELDKYEAMVKQYPIINRLREVFDLDLNY